MILFLPMHLQRMVDEEELQFHEEYMNEQDPSILHFLLASGDDVCLSIISHGYVCVLPDNSFWKDFYSLTCRSRANNFVMT